MAKGFIIYTHCCMGETVAVLMAYNAPDKMSTGNHRLDRDRAGHKMLS